MWLVHYPTYQQLSVTFHVSISVISKDLHHVIPIIVDTFKDEIRWPDAEEHLGIIYTSYTKLEII